MIWMAGAVRFAISATQLNMGFSPGAGDILKGGTVRFTPLVFSAQYNAERWSITSEYAFRHLEYKNFGPGLPNMSFSGESYYFQGAYRFTPEWEGIVRYDVLYTDGNDPNGTKWAAARPGVRPILALPRISLLACAGILRRNSCCARNTTASMVPLGFRLSIIQLPVIWLSTGIFSQSSVPIASSHDLMEQNLHKGHGSVWRRLKLGPHQFLGLKWKVLLLSSLILIAIVVSFTGITYQSLMSDFENQRDVQHQRYGREVEGLIDQISQNLHQLAQLIPFLEGMNTALLANSGKSIAQTFDPYWAPLQLNKDIELIRFYDSSNRLLAHWGNSESYAEENVMLKWVGEANAREQPISPLSCQKSCTQFAVTPLLVEGKNVGVVVIGIPLVDVVLGFKDISGAHIGLLMKDQGNKVNNNDMKIANWNFQVAAHSRDMNVAILNKAAELYPDFDNLEEGVQIVWANQYLQVKPLPLEKIGGSGKAQLIVVTDITSTIRTIQGSTQQSILIGVVGLILSEILLFIILTRPLSRLKHIVFTLPLLARSSFHDFRTGASFRQSETVA